MLIVSLVLNLIIGIPVAAIILRASVSLANRFLGGPEQTSQMQEIAMSESAGPADPEDPYSAPTVVTAVTDGAIPVPGFGHACGISLAQMMAAFLLSFAFGMVIGVAIPGAATVWGSMLFSFVITIPVYAGILSAMLPTTFGRSLLVMLCQLLIGVAIGAVLVVTMMLLRLSL